MLTRADYRRVLARINRYYQSPPAPEVPEALSLRAGGVRLRLDSEGVHLLSRRDGTSVIWSEVEAADILRRDPLSIGFYRLSLKGQGREFRLRTDSGKVVGSKHTPEVVAEFLRQHVAEDRFSISIAGEPLASRALVERELAAAEDNWEGVLSAPLILSFALVPAWLTGEWVFLLLLIPLLPMSLYLAWKSRRYAQQWRDLLIDDAWKTRPPPFDEE